MNLAEKLRELIRTKGMDSYNDDRGMASALTRALYDGGYITVNHRKNDYVTEQEERIHDLGTISRKIRKHLSGERELPDSEYLRAYCKFFGCSADYLLGLSDSPTPSAVPAKDYLGLPQGVCERLRNYPDHNKLILSNLVYDKSGKDKSDHMARLLDAVYKYAMFAGSPDTRITLENPSLKVSSSSQEDPKTVRAILTYTANEAFRDCLELSCELTGPKRLQRLADEIKEYEENKGEHK